MQVADAYLGDGVYAHFDGFGIVLDLRGQDSTTKITLEPLTLKKLNEYDKMLRAGASATHQIEKDGP